MTYDQLIRRADDMINALRESRKVGCHPDQNLSINSKIQGIEWLRDLIPEFEGDIE